MANEPEIAGGSPSRDDQIRAATIGEPTRVDGPIHLAEYDDAWPVLFEREAVRIRSLLRACRTNKRGGAWLSGGGAGS